MSNIKHHDLSPEHSEKGSLPKGSLPYVNFLSPNKFKLGLFGLNCSGGLTMTKAPEYWDASYENNLVVAQLAEEAG